jgi:D-alanine-D-alanine ligase
VRPYAILWNDDANVEGGGERDALAVLDSRGVVDAIRGALSGLGPVVEVTTGRGDPEEIAHELKRAAPRCVVNLAEAVRGVAALEGGVASLLELLGLPYTGNSPATLALCLDKPRTKLLLAGACIPVAPGAVVRDAERDALLDLAYPVIVKPACMDASHGIDETSVVGDERAARAKAAEVIRRFPPAALVETYIDGDDALVGILQERAGARPTALPLGMIDFRLPAGVPRVSTFASKWEVGSEAFEKTPGVYPAPFAPDVARRIREVSLAAFEAVGCRDYARVDVRVDRSGGVHVLEVNPNPSLAPDVGLARAAAVGGRPYEDLVRLLVRNAEERGALSALPHSR